MQALEAARCVEEGVVTDVREADVGSILGFGFAPFSGGTLSYIDMMGTKRFVELCKRLEKKYGDRVSSHRSCSSTWRRRTIRSTAASRRERRGRRSATGRAMTDPGGSFLRWRQIPGGVWALGVVSLLMDLSSEMIHALLPLYLAVGLGASMLTVGIIEGIAEATALIVKIFSGAISDWLGRRKLLVVIGYGLAAFTKPVFPLATSIGWLFAARFVDRIGKGIRGAPRDALIADLYAARRARCELRAAAIA